MDAVYTEIEFAHEEHTPGELYQALKRVPTVVLYRKAIDKSERFAVIVFNDRNLPDVTRVAQKHAADVVSQHDVTHAEMLEVCKGTVPKFIDGFDTRDSRFWLAP